MSKKQLSTPMGQTAFFGKGLSMFSYLNLYLSSLSSHFIAINEIFCNLLFPLKKSLFGSFDFVGKDDDDRGHDQALPYMYHLRDYISAPRWCHHHRCML